MISGVIRKNKYWLLGLVLVFFLYTNSFSQQTHFPVKIDSSFYASKLDSIKHHFPECSNIPLQFELPFYTALSKYPELQLTHIEFAVKSIRTTMAARPATGLFKNRSKRTYHVYANNNKDFKGVYLSSLTFNQQTGVIGHELAHIVDYSHKSTLRLIGNGIAYLFTSYRRTFEANTDKRAISHGFGWQLFDYVDFLLNRSKASEKYKKMKRKVYLNENDIKQIIISTY